MYSEVFQTTLSTKQDQLQGRRGYSRGKAVVGRLEASGAGISTKSSNSSMDWFQGGVFIITMDTRCEADMELYGHWKTTNIGTPRSKVATASHYRHGTVFALEVTAHVGQTQ
ncbi:hypothetical protein BaRGS_00017057 [Batillaria attramentaria]|uniref:Uncharacterized protein n=1 Tax=Batillaria attramentaria TaxID=370345 RepID=A0ABD0KXQ5_9CAEN